MFLPVVFLYFCLNLPNYSLRWLEPCTFIIILKIHGSFSNHLLFSSLKLQSVQLISNQVFFTMSWFYILSNLAYDVNPPYCQKFNKMLLKTLYKFVTLITIIWKQNNYYVATKQQQTSPLLFSSSTLSIQHTHSNIAIILHKNAN